MESIVLSTQIELLTDLGDHFQNTKTPDSQSLAWPGSKHLLLSELSSAGQLAQLHMNASRTSHVSQLWLNFAKDSRTRML